MKLGELVASARRIGPIRCVDGDGVPVEAGFATAGAVEISVNDGAYAAALGAITVIGDGYVYYEATEPDASVQGAVTLKLEGICQESTFREEVEAAPQGIPVDTVDPDLRHVGPLRIVDADLVELASLVGIDCEVSLNGAAWDAPAGALALIEAGYADYAADATEVGDVGWIAVKLTGACQEFVFRATVVAPSAGGPGDETAPTCEAVTPEGEIAVTDEIVVDVSDDLELAYIAAFVSFNGGRRTAVFRRGAFEAGYSLGSYVEDIAGPGVKSRLHIIPDNDWPADTEIKITLDPVDGGGNVGA